MSTTAAPPPNRSNDDIIDTTPFLTSPSSSSTSSDGETRRSVRRQGLREAARFLRRASSRRLMREPSMLVRETAAEQLEERQSDWAYSKPVVVLDLIWNFAFVAVAAAVLFLSRNEDANMPLRLWIVGYAGQCVLHMVCVVVEYKRRQRRRVRGAVDDGSLSPGGGARALEDEDEEEHQYVSFGQQLDNEERTRYMFIECVSISMMY